MTIKCRVETGVSASYFQMNMADLKDARDTVRAENTALTKRIPPITNATIYSILAVLKKLEHRSMKRITVIELQRTPL